MEALKTHQYFKEEYPNLPFTFLPIDSMIDGKSKNTLTGNGSTRSCSDCKATPTQIKMDLEDFFEVENEDYLKCGARSLHTLPRTMEYVFHVASAKPAEELYQKTLEEKGKTITRGKNKGKKKLTPADKKELKEKQKLLTEAHFEAILDLFEERYGIRPFQPCSKGGNVNTGNLARLFFSDLQFLADITDLPLEFLTRLKNLCLITRSTVQLDYLKVKEYCRESKELWKASGLQFYGLPPTVHQLFDHLWQYVQHSPVPLGLLSEEPLEASNKDFRSGLESDSF